MSQGVVSAKLTDCCTMGVPWIQRVIWHLARYLQPLPVEVAVLGSGPDRGLHSACATSLGVPYKRQSRRHLGVSSARLLSVSIPWGIPSGLMQWYFYTS